ncbi:MAG: hypothetical protein ACI4MK_00255 [Aristaeellaceae bacterium]
MPEGIDKVYFTASSFDVQAEGNGWKPHQIGKAVSAKNGSAAAP